MRVYIYLLSVLFTGAMMISASSHAQEMRTIRTSMPSVVELFTAQGCGECPLADTIFLELAENPEIITLGFHVTYHDHLGWKDALSQNFATQRQQGYSAQAGANKVRTPQMIINGTHIADGQSKDAIEKALKQSRAPQALDMWKDGAVINVKLPTLNNAQNLQIWFYALKSEHYQAIAGGANSGKMMTYASPVIAMRDLGKWDGHGKMLSAPLPKIEGIESAIILVQQNGFGPIVAAGRIKF